MSLRGSSPEASRESVAKLPQCPTLPGAHAICNAMGPFPLCWAWAGLVTCWVHTGCGSDSNNFELRPYEDLYTSTYSFGL